MPQHHRPKLSDDQRRNLEQARDHDPRPDVRERCAAVLKVADGMRPGQVAAHGLLRPRDRDTIYGWLRHYAAEGLAGLTAHRHGGPRRRGL